MDLLDRVRDLGADPEPREEGIEAARARLERAIAEAPPRSHRRARWAIGGGVGLLVAAAATTAIVVLGSGTAAIDPVPTADTAATPAPTPDVTLSPPPEPAPEPTPDQGGELTAAGVLERAAVVAATSATPLAAGQYLRVENHLEQLVTYAEGVDPNSPYNATRENATAAWVARGSYSTYIPADRAGEWLRVFEADRQIVAVFGTDAETLAADWLSVALDERIVNRYQGGLDVGGETPVYASDEYFAMMPRDPAALLAWERARLTAGNVENIDEGIVAVLVQDLELNAAPADLRSAMFRALALAEGVTIRSVDGPITTLEFPSIGSGRALVATVSVDAESGNVVASTVTSLPGSSFIPDSVPDSRVTTTVTVVDSAP